MILVYDLEGHKEIPGLWLSPTESKKQWMQIFDELKTRGVEEVDTTKNERIRFYEISKNCLKCSNESSCLFAF